MDAITWHDRFMHIVTPHLSGKSSELTRLVAGIDDEITRRRGARKPAPRSAPAKPVGRSRKKAVQFER